MMVLGKHEAGAPFVLWVWYDSLLMMKMLFKAVAITSTWRCHKRPSVGSITLDPRTPSLVPSCCSGLGFSSQGELWTSQRT